MSGYDDVFEALQSKYDLTDDQTRTILPFIQQDTVTRDDLVTLLDSLQETDDDSPQVYVFGEDDYETPAVTLFDILDLQKSHGPADSETTLVEKGVSGSSARTEEIDQSAFFGYPKEYVNPPYCPEGLRRLLELDPVHMRAVKAKVRDAVVRGFKFVPCVPLKALDEKMGEEEDVGTPEPLDAVPQEDVDNEIKIAKKFLRNCNRVIGFSGILERAAMDLEAIGWCAIEVVRNMDGEVKRLSHIPAERVRVLKDWEGFVEITKSGNDLKLVHYQPFGEKWRSSTRVGMGGLPEVWDPEEDGTDITSGQPNYIDRYTGEPTDSFEDAANEIIFKVQHHPRSIYYGIPDIVPAIDNLMANVEIRKYLLQFFSNNTVPRYAVILKGARLSEDDIRTLKKYFDQEVRGSAHRTLFIPIRSTRGNVEIKFERLDADNTEASFQETQNNNNQQIMVAHGTPPAILGINETSAIVAGKGNAQADIYKDRIVDPLQRSWAESLTDLFHTGLGLTLIKPEFDPLDTRDRLSEMETWTGWAKGGHASINEVRQKILKWPPVIGGDRHFVLSPEGLRFVDDLPDAESAEPAGLAESTPTDSNRKTGFSAPEDEDGDNNDKGSGG